MLALFLRDMRLGIRAGGGALTGILFFLAVVAVIPFGVGPDLNLLARIGPAILWIAALLAGLLGLDRLFQADREDGSLDRLILNRDRHMLALVVFVKCAAHWTASILPLVVAAPLFALVMNMDLVATAATTLTLLVGTPAIAFIGAVGASVAVALPRGGLLVSSSWSCADDPGADLRRVRLLRRRQRPRSVPAALPAHDRSHDVLAVLGPLAAALALRWAAD